MLDVGIYIACLLSLCLFVYGLVCSVLGGIVLAVNKMLDVSSICVLIASSLFYVFIIWLLISKVM